ncbi:MAG: hypothetical protein WCN92_00585 [Eubacteriales bacterium]
MISTKNHLLRKKESSHIGCYETVIFVFLLFEFISLTSNKTLYSAGFVTTHYLLSYKFGFDSRFLIGSIVSLFTDHVTLHTVFVAGATALIFLIFLISLFLGCAIRNSHIEIRSAIIVFAVLFLASPLSVTYLMGFHFARMDTYWIIITLLALFCLKRPNLRLLVPLLCAAAILVHQGYMVTYMPALAVPIFYEIYNNKYSKKSIAIFCLSCLIMICMFLFLQFFPANIPFNNSIDFAAYLSKNAGFKAYAPMLYLEYYAPFPNWWLELMIPVIKTLALPWSLILLTFSAPLLIIFSYIWKQSFRFTSNKFLKFVFFLCLAAPLAFIPAALFGMDWDRWWAAVINNQFIIIFYFIYSNEETVIVFIKKAGDFLINHFLLLLMIIIFTNSLTFSTASDLVNTLIAKVGNVSDFIVNYFNNTVYK